VTIVIFQSYDVDTAFNGEISSRLIIAPVPRVPEIQKLFES